METERSQTFICWFRSFATVPFFLCLSPPVCLIMSNDSALNRTEWIAFYSILFDDFGIYSFHFDKSDCERGHACVHALQRTVLTLSHTRSHSNRYSFASSVIIYTLFGCVLHAPHTLLTLTKIYARLNEFVWVYNVICVCCFIDRTRINSDIRKLYGVDDDDDFTVIMALTLLLLSLVMYFFSVVFCGIQKLHFIWRNFTFK